MTPGERQHRREDRAERSFLTNILKGRTLLPKALRRKPPPPTVHHDANGNAFTVLHLPVICTPYPSPWEHPIYWWKMRHLRADIEVHRDALDGMISAELEQQFDALMDDAFLNGTGGA